MAATWATKVSEAKGHLDKQSGFRGAAKTRWRARFRQYGLCLATAQEQIEYLTGASNAERDDAYAQYSSARNALHALRAELDLQSQGFGSSEVEAAERAADAALLRWCTA